ncbi:hypothetical protein [Streptomyces sp. NPDC088794]|uniref:hypothetical protein n=1 Tax=Streptomyces sp. NPDC088794 TaxID=3365902 RepID=UPI003809C46F
MGSFVLSEHEAGTRLVYGGELRTDPWRAGAWWGEKVAARWEVTVAASLGSVEREAECWSQP